MSSIKSVVGRVRGDEVKHLSDEVAALRTLVYELNHRVAQMSELLTSLNHDVRSGADEALPLFHGYLERVRNDAETSLSATQVIERQLAALDARIEQLTKLTASADG
jgi:ubiquinone biosynthesis protein UbiJ